MDETNRIKPCPFCGGPARVVLKSFDIFDTGAYVMCEKCGARTALITNDRNKKPQEEAIKRWNKRV